MREEKQVPVKQMVATVSMDDQPSEKKEEEKVLPAVGTFSYTLAAEWNIIRRSDVKSYCSNPYMQPINERLNMARAVALLLKGGMWTPYDAVTDIGDKGLFLVRDVADVTKTPLFNEYLYFNSHMRRLIYNQTDYQAEGADAVRYANAVEANGDAVVVLQWAPCLKKDASYAYYLYRQMPDGSRREYRLPINSIELRLYSVGIMLLCIRCQQEDIQKSLEGFYTYRDFTADEVEAKPYTPVSTSDDLAWIENCGRRLFASRIYVDSVPSSSAFFNDFPVLSVIAPEAPNPFNMASDWSKANDHIVLCDYREAASPSNLTYTQPEHLDFVRKLIAPGCVSRLMAAQTKYSGDLLVIDCFNDERMYHHGTVISNEIVERTLAGWQNRKDEKIWDKLKWWYAVLFADSEWNSPSCKNEDMLVSKLESATEPRWADWGTFHGMTYHSMVTLAGCGMPDYLYANNDWIYLQMFLIAVLQRCTIQRFYREASGLLQSHSQSDSKCRAAVLEQYTVFLNQFWFYEVTEQEQGKDMFNRLQEAMNIDRDVEFLNGALEELHQQASNKVETTVNNLLLPLSIIGGIAACVDLFDMSRQALGCQFGPAKIPLAWILLILVLIVTVVYGINQWRYLSVGRCRHKLKKGKKRS